ncbi:sialate O-acetylesterase [Pontiellaceae bacterium B12227]|nr:sialate O-acetylesterase [Pontiellaceae bacterium B12227]
MVLQRGKPVPVWGTAEPGEKITVAFAGQKKTALADSSNHWKVVLKPMSASSKPRKMTVSGSSKNPVIQLSNLLVGDVWLCSGQSNMEFTLKNTLESEALLQSADHPSLRLLEVPGRKMVAQPGESFDASWNSASPEAAATFSGVGFLFGQRIHMESGVPIGLIECAKGSSSVECWVSKDTIETKLFAPAVKKWREVEANWDNPQVRKKHIHKSVKDPDAIQPSEARTYPSSCYNTMLHPLFPFALKGVVWYQGEANRFRGQQYRELFPAMVGEWRERFGQDDLKFYVVQLPEMGKTPEQSGNDSPFAELREAQWLTVQHDPLMEMAVIIDTDPQGNLHPKNKQLPGDRLARIALAKDYGKDVEYSGPLFREIKIKGRQVHLIFDHADGLMVGKRATPTSVVVEAVEEPLAHFAVAGADRKFHPAKAMIDQGRIVVACDAVAKPVAVRYAWADNPTGCNLYNQAGLPAVPFRTDDWPCVSEGKLDGKVLVIR